jgi:hypothetical protein
MTEQERAGAAQAGAPQGPDPARRMFLMALPFGALAAVAAPAGAAGAAPQAASDAAAAAQGYHETDHIRRYYQTAAYW